MDPLTLGHVLKYPDTPDVHKVTIKAYRIKLWDGYSALVIGLPEQIVHGIACKSSRKKRQKGWLCVRLLCT